MISRLDITVLTIAMSFAASYPCFAGSIKSSNSKDLQSLRPTTSVKVSKSTSTALSLPGEQTIRLNEDPFNQNYLTTEQINARTFALDAGPWQKYLSSPPKIFVIKRPSRDIQKLLTTEQELIKMVIEADVSVSETTEYSALEERLQELQTAIPQAETRTGYVKSSRKYYKRTYVSGSTIYTNSYPYYYNYRVFKEKAQSSSPELVRSVLSIATNAELKDLDSRINALQHFISKWKRKISLMSTNGTEGIMRKANTAYISGLEDYTGEFIKLNTELKRIEQAQEARKAQRANIIQNWQNFENTNLKLLQNYFQQSDIEVISTDSGMSYQITETQLKKSLILACEIGPRTLYFEIDGRSAHHPFALLDVSPSQN